MAEPHVISTLCAKRAELAGEVQAAEKRLDQLRADLVHLDAVLRVFGANVRPEQIAPKRSYRRRGWFKHKELPRLILGALRDASEPVTARDLALVVMASKGMDVGDAATLDEIGDAVRRYLRRQQGRLVEQAGRSEGAGRTALWRTAR